MAIDAWGLFFPHRGRQLQLQAGCAVLYLMVAGIAPCGSVDGHVSGCDGRVSVSRILCQIEAQEELLRRTSAAGGTTGHSHRLSERLRLRGGRWGGGGGGYKREYDQVSDENIPTFGIMNPSDEHPQIPFARKEGKIIEFEFPEGMTEDDDAEQLGEDRAARAERRRRARERELAGVNPVLEERDEASPPPNGGPVLSSASPFPDSLPACLPASLQRPSLERSPPLRLPLVRISVMTQLGSGPEDEEDERPLKDQFLATLSDDEREVTKEFIEYQQKKDPVPTPRNTIPENTSRVRILWTISFLLDFAAYLIIFTDLPPVLPPLSMLPPPLRQLPCIPALPLSILVLPQSRRAR
eukprot:2223829-Rhodomonas_salina.1